MPILAVLTSFQGRIGRLTYLVATVLLMVISQIAMATIGYPLVISDFTIWHYLLMLAFAIPHWAVATKRAHDISKSGWWLFGWTMGSFGCLFLMVAASVIGVSGSFGTAVVITLVACLLSLASFYQVVIKLLFFRGAIGNNDFGPPSQLIQHLLNDGDVAMPIENATQFVATPARVPVIATAGKIATAPNRSAPRPTSTAPAGFGRRNSLRTN